MLINYFSFVNLSFINLSFVMELRKVDIKSFFFLYNFILTE